MAILTMAQIYAYARQAGFNQDEATIATAIAMAESGGNTNALNPSGATGLWQIFPAQPGSTDPLTNAQQAFAKYKSQYWCAWAVYDEGSSTGSACPGSGTSQRNNSWRGFLAAAQAVSGVTGGGVGGGNGGGNSGGGGGGSSSSGSSPQPGPVTTAAVNTFLSEFSGPLVTASAITLLILGLMLWKGQTVVKATVKGAKTAAAVAA